MPVGIWRAPLSAVTGYHRAEHIGDEREIINRDQLFNHIQQNSYR